MRAFTPMTIQQLATHLANEADQDRRWLLLLEFLEEYEHEAAPRQRALVEDEPGGTGDARWDALLAGITEWLATRAGFFGPPWASSPERKLDEPWCPQDLPSLRRLADEHAPPEIRRHGVLIDPQDLARA